MTTSKQVRWISNLGISCLNPLVVQLLFPILAVDMALKAQDGGWGLLNGMAMFNHRNIRIPLGLDRLLRYFVVTPDMHRVHHSVIIRETNSNFGFNLPWWDRLFGTYKAQPSKGHIEMTIGLVQFRNINQLMFHHLLLLPFTGDTGRQPINRH